MSTEIDFTKKQLFGYNFIKMNEFSVSFENRQFRTKEVKIEEEEGEVVFAKVARSKEGLSFSINRTFRKQYQYFQFVYKSTDNVSYKGGKYFVLY